MNNVGYDIGRTTIQRILAEHGIAPAPQRKREYSWATFIKAHLGAIAGMDFFTVEVLTVVGLVRYHVLFVIDIGSRIVEVVGLARDPGSVWMKQMARNLLDADAGFLCGKRYDPGPRSSVHKGLPGDATRGRGEAATAACTEPQLERICGTICTIDQERMPRPNPAARRETWRTEPPRSGECAAHGSAGTGESERPSAAPRATRRPAELLSSDCGLIGARSDFGTGPGRPKKAAEIERLLLEMATRNTT
jgi:hypothetical protein